MYGQNPNSGTTNMIGQNKLAKQLKKLTPSILPCFVVLMSVLPKEVLAFPWVDFVTERGCLCSFELKPTWKWFTSRWNNKVKGIGYAFNMGYSHNNEQPPARAIF